MSSMSRDVIVLVFLTVIASCLRPIHTENDCLGDSRTYEHCSRKKRTILLTEKVSTLERIRSEGYVAERYTVTTQDGYILELHRIPFGRNEKPDGGPYKTRSPDTSPVESRSKETRSVETHSGEVSLLETRSVETSLAETHSKETSPVETLSGDVSLVVTHSGEASSVETLSGEAIEILSGEASSVETRSGEASSVETLSGEAIESILEVATPVGTLSGEASSIETLSGEAIESLSGEASSVEILSEEANPVETRSGEASSVEPLSGEAIESLLEEATPVETLSMDNTPVETRFVDTTPVETSSGEISPVGIGSVGTSPIGTRSEEATLQPPRPAVLLMHCIFCSSIDWLLNSPDKALGFMLADSGYDVWMANSRGNKYSKKHIKLSPKQKQFWKFSFHEIAVFDLPAMIDFILNKTGNAQLSYIGYSMGSAVFYALMSERPEYNNKVKVAAILGPAGYMTNSKGTIFRFSPWENIIERTSNLLGFYDVNLQSPLTNALATTLCHRKRSILNDLCWPVFSLLIAIDQEFVNREFLPLILSNMMAGGSVRTVIHFMQVKNADRFQQYSYGRRGNLWKYGSLNPPLYNLNRTMTPVGLFTGKGDVYVGIKDVNRLAKELPNVVLRYEVSNPNFSHFDFLWANDATDILYKHVLQLLEDYQ